ncbi:AcrR family transcriptional regulator [Spinactinospora alkalitolerans]|uniref:AcrR family transcriptional regulator n=1 Tax=Spinactinospora alkalitolerans TaxID=687207 RepID=A0A852TQF7_9ACTN|nr:TetR family transcriptional regulator [Spinactinospora alkalitolerans]NYE45771.1 AcrR family transcriptional regulator [Spinactinospora alkalitolerans]
MIPVNEAGGTGGPPARGVRDRLIDAAYSEIVSGHWARMRMADIASAAGVSRQTLYNEFGTKEGLLQAVVLREAEAFLDRVMEILTDHDAEPARAVGQAARWTLTASGQNLLLRAIITGDTGLLPVLTTRAEPLQEALGERMTAFLLERRPELGERAAAIAEVSLRLTISYVLLPIDTDQAVQRVELAVHSMFLAARELPEPSRR